MNIFGLLCHCSMFNCQLSFAEKTKPRRALRLLGVFIPGNDLVSHAVARAVPSALRGLTSVFGMGTGVTLSVRSPENFWVLDDSILMGKASAQTGNDLNLWNAIYDQAARPISTGKLNRLP